MRSMARFGQTTRSMPQCLLCREVLRPASVDQLYDRFVHYKRRGISIFPGRIDTNSSTIYGPCANEHLFAEQHVARWIETSKDPPLEVFVIVHFDVGTYGHDDETLQWGIFTRFD